MTALMCFDAMAVGATHFTQCNFGLRLGNAFTKTDIAVFNVSDVVKVQSDRALSVPAINASDRRVIFIDPPPDSDCSFIGLQVKALAICSVLQSLFAPLLRSVRIIVARCSRSILALWRAVFRGSTFSLECFSTYAARVIVR